MRIDARGTVQGNTITLDGAPDLPPGVPVEAESETINRDFGSL